jgi:hypothetical protein
VIPKDDTARAVHFATRHFLNAGEDSQWLIIPGVSQSKGAAMLLTADQIRSFHNAGFLQIAEPAIGHRDLERLRALFDRMFEERAGRADGHQFDLASPDEEGKPEKLSQILFPHRYYPELHGAYVETIRDIARQLLGPEVVTEIFHAILKPAGIGVATPWHQDEAYWEPDRQYRSASIWMPLQEATLENGCLWVQRRQP